MICESDFEGVNMSRRIDLINPPSRDSKNRKIFTSHFQLHTRTKVETEMASTKGKSKELDEALSAVKSLLSRIQCKNSTTLNPPDEASTALGTRLASIFATGYLLSSQIERRVKEWAEKGEEIVELFCNGESNVNGATIQGFFDTLVGDERLILTGDMDVKEKTVCRDFLRLWMTLTLKCEESVRSSYQKRERNMKTNRFWVLPIALRFYVRLAHKYFMSLEGRKSQTFSIEEDSDLCFIVNLYESLCIETSREYLARECINATFDNIGFASIQFLTPLLSAAVISAPLFKTEQCQESSRFVSCLMKKCFSVKIHRNRISLDLIISWLAAAIKAFYVSFSSHNDAQFTHSALCIGYDWLDQILQLISSSQNIYDFEGNLKMDTIPKLINVALEFILPEYSPNYQNGCLPSLGPILVQINETIRTMNISTTLSCKALFNLEALCLVLTDQESIKVMMEILTQIITRWDNKRERRSVIIGGAHCIGCIFASSHICRNAAATLISLTTEIMMSETVDTPLQQTDCFHLVELFGSHRLGPDHLKLIEALPFCSSGGSTEGLVHISITNQCETLLLCLSFIQMLPSNDMHSEQLDCILKSLGSLLGRFPNLGIRCLPVFITSIQKFMEENNISNIFKLMGFACSVLARDPSCAHEVWSLLSTMAELHAPVKIQCMAIRLYALLCDANKRLYGRVCDSMQRHADHPNAELRIACSATLCEMAKMDVIRDLSNIIGNIQIFLSDEEPIVVHFAVLCLHHLIMVDELDFAMVIKVLGKKLVKVHDVEAILQLSDCVFEPLVLLLGDGEEGSSSGSEESSEGAYDVDLQVQESVSALIDLAKELSNQSLESSKKKYLGLIYDSLTRYTSSSLGIDEDMVRSVLHSPDEAHEDYTRYYDLKFIILRGIDAASNDGIEIKSVVQTASRLAMNIMQIEEAALGPTLWKHNQKKHSSATKVKKTLAISNDVLMSLPRFQTIFDRYEDNPSLASGCAVLQCLQGFGGSNLDGIMSLISDIVYDMQSQCDLLSNTFVIQSWIIGMSNVWHVIKLNYRDEEEIMGDIVVEKILAWSDEMGMNDIAYIGLSAFAYSVDGPKMNNLLDNAHAKVLEAYDMGDFDSDAAASIALGLVVLKNIQSASFQQVCTRMEKLELKFKRSVDEGNLCFEAAHSMGLIIQALATMPTALKRNDISMMSRRIFSLLVMELGNFMDSKGFTFQTLAVCIQTNKPTTDLLKVCDNMKEADLSIRDDRHTTILNIIIALSIAMPYMLHLHSDFLRALYKIAIKMPWGSGKGLIIASIHRIHESSGLLDSTEFSDLFNNSSMAFEQDQSDFNDAAFILAELSLKSKDTSSLERCIRTLERSASVSRSFRVSTIYACLKNVSHTLPALFGSDDCFVQISRLRPETSKEDVQKVVKILSNIADGPSEDSRARQAAVVSLGIISSMQYASSDNLTSYYQVSTKIQQLTGSNSVNKKVQPLESAKEGSITQEIVEKTVISLADTNTDQTLKCLQNLSLPGSFAKFVEAMLITNSSEELKESCVDVILGQINIERRSASDRREFVLISSSLARLSPTSFFSQLGKHGGFKFIRSLRKFIPQWTNNVIGESINTLLETCSQEHEILGTKLCMAILLKEIEAIIRSQSSQRTMPPSALTNIQIVLIQKFLPTLCSCIGMPCSVEENTEDTDLNTWNAYFSCISHIPMTMLDSQSFFSFEESDGTSKNIVRACAISFLQKQGNLSSSNFSQLLRAQLWLAKQNPQNTDPMKQVYWRTAAQLSEAGQDMPPAAKKEFIHSLFEILLVNGLDSFCIDQLAIQVAFWDIYGSYHHPLLIFQPGAVLHQSNFQTKKLSNLLLRESPKVIGSLFRSLGISNWILNRVIQIVSKLSSDGSSQMGYDTTHLMDVAYCSNDYSGGKLKHAFLIAFAIENEIMESRIDKS